MEMEKIVRQLDELEQPWNCPHGRSTLRIWTNLSPFLRKDEEGHDDVSEYEINDKN